MLEGTHTEGDSGSQTESEVQSPENPPEPAVSEEADAEETADERAEELPLDVTFEILKNRRRRLVLQYLRDAEETTSIGELAEHIAAIENDTTVKQLNAQQRKRVYIGLYQCHLPKMDDAGVVEFNQDRGRIDPGPNVAPLYNYLDVGVEEESSSYELYSGSVLAVGVLFLAAQLSSAYMVANAIVVGFLLAVLFVTYRLRTKA
ncbi:DUF7344 domain-containing protein [Halobacterium wangiae]|uniref:DUF7344 domain-containing protein n=1 Tax=Halobacterium wangiae TaxID=2902623 RepID=UPI001E357066|nr:hypothetical protein [Halobacterium wangiae]